VTAAKSIPGHHQVVELLGDCAMIQTTKAGAVAGVLLLVALDEPLYIGILAPQWPPGLAHRRRRDRGQRRCVSSERTAAIEGLALRKPPPPAAFVHRQVCDVARRAPPPDGALYLLVY
jgi:hypothetical protein